MKPLLEILYRDDHYVAVNKPPGLLVHRSRIAADAEDFLLQRQTLILLKCLRHNQDDPLCSIPSFLIQGKARLYIHTMPHEKKEQLVFQPM